MCGVTAAAISSRKSRMYQLSKARNADKRMVAQIIVKFNKR